MHDQKHVRYYTELTHDHVEECRTRGCGCYFCIRMFPFSEISVVRNESPICPYCSLDMVIPRLYDSDQDFYRLLCYIHLLIFGD